MLAITGNFVEAADALRMICSGLRATDACEFALDEFLCRIRLSAKIDIGVLSYEQRCWALGVLGVINQQHAIRLDGWQTMMLREYKNKR